MYVYLINDGNVTFPDGVTSMGNVEYSQVELEPFFIFHHKKNKTYNTWVPSVWDLLADDWYEVEK